VGLELVAAIAFGTLAAAAAILRRGPPPPRLQIGLAVAVAAWLIPGFIALSSVSQLHERYIESISAPIAAALGIGVASLLRLAAERALGIACFAVALGVSVVFTFERAHLGGTATVIVLAAILAIAAAAAARATRLAVAVPIACALAGVALLAAPLK